MLAKKISTKKKKKIVRKSKKKSSVRVSIRKIDQPDEQDTTTTVLASSDILQGKYSNVAMIKHTAREFIIEFILKLDNQANLVSRILTSPAHAKELYEALGKNITRYEKTYGKIIIDITKTKPPKSVH